MPELPEVETMRRGIAGIVGRTVASFDRPRSKQAPIRFEPEPAVIRRKVLGRRVAAVGRAGKRVVIEFDSADRLVIEPRMTGRLLVDQPVDLGYIRMVLELDGGPPHRVLFRDVRGLGVVRLLNPAEFERELGPDRLGPDALEISIDELASRLGRSRRPIKVALLDQRVLAGVGNLYASEILHRAKLHPAAVCSELKPRHWRLVHASMIEVLAEAVRLQGSTLSDGTYGNVSNQPGGYQDSHRVYQRDGQPCLQCGRGQIVRLVQAQRSTFFCPRCQKGA